MNKLITLGILFFCGILIALADAFIKKSAISGNYSQALKSPWLYWSVLLYLVQIALVIYVFLYHWKLGILANVFNVFYSIISLLAGYLIFAEKLAPIQAMGVFLGLIGVILMTLTI